MRYGYYETIYTRGYSGEVEVDNRESEKIAAPFVAKAVEFAEGFNCPVEVYKTYTRIIAEFVLSPEPFEGEKKQLLGELIGLSHSFSVSGGTLCMKMSFEFFIKNIPAY